MTPLLQWIIFPSTPFNKTTRVLEENIYSIQATHLSPKPLALSKVTIAWCSILSNAFLKSNFRTTVSFS
jgi:hypothetical protein